VSGARPAYQPIRAHVANGCHASSAIGNTITAPGS
jgi:hypothetical protein